MTFRVIQCQREYHKLIYSGLKTTEGRKRSEKFRDIQVGEVIVFESVYTDEKDSIPNSFYARVTSVNYYKTLNDFLNGETIEKCLPGVKDLETARSIYLQWSTEDEINETGFMGIQVSVVKSNS